MARRRMPSRGVPGDDSEPATDPTVVTFGDTQLLWPLMPTASAAYTCGLSAFMSIRFGTSKTSVTVLR